MKKAYKQAVLSAIVVSSISALPFSPAYSESTQKLINNSASLGKKIFAAEFYEELPEWLKRTEIDASLNSEGKPDWSVLTIQPLYQSAGDQHTIFTQGRLAHGNNGRTTGNLGFGYRRLFADDTILAGINTFADYEWPYSHSRVGGGLELRSSAFEWNANIYHATSGWNNAETGFEERALDGYDFEVGTQVPYLPWAKVFARKFYWDSETAAKDIQGQTYSIRLRPFTNGLEIEAGTSDHNRAKSNQFVQLRYRLGFGGPDKSERRIGWVSKRPFETGESMASKTLEKVRRQNTITVERRSTGGGGTATVTMARGT